MSKQRTLKKKVSKALDDRVLRGALKTFADRFYTMRTAAYADIDFERLRNEIAEMKKKAIENIEALADEFQEKIEKRGARVYRAGTGNDVIRIIKEICAQRNAHLCVKSKSIASEEIHLNEHLEEALKVVETDLGEWLIQQVHETPSHMVLPAIHLTKERCAEIFCTYLGKKVEPEIKSLVKEAREIMRRHFLNADIGISGCNIAVAETGTVCIFSNEGNVRLTSTLPPVHIILFGYEKLVPTLRDVTLIAKALPRSATGQLLTSYLSMISGPVETFQGKDSNKTAPKELHIIFLDNGRRRMLSDPIFREAGQCIRCTSCLNVCPVYQLVGGHVYGKIYPGAIGSMLTYFFNSVADAEQIQELCISCGLCRDICPAKIDIPHLTLELRKCVRDSIELPFLVRVILEKILPARGLFRLGMHSAAVMSAPLSAKGDEEKSYIRKLPFGMDSMTRQRSLPGISSRSFTDRFKQLEQIIRGTEKGTVAFFVGCAIDWIYPEIGDAVVKVMNNAGYRVALPRQSCCGAPGIYAGSRKSELKLAIQNINNFDSDEFEYIVSACPTCSHVIKHLWRDAVKDNSALVEKMTRISEKVIDFVTLMYQLQRGVTGLLPQEELTADTGEDKIPSVTYHMSCHLARSMHIKTEPMEVLKSLEGIRFVKMNEVDRCCGFGGTYSIKFPEISRELLEQKIKNIQESGAGIVVCDCPGCLVNIRGGLDSHHSPIKAMHTAELLARLYKKK